MTLRKWLPILLGPVLWALWGCAGRAPPEAAPAADAGAQGALPDDAQGIELFLAENRGTVARADLAAERAAGEETRALARLLAAEHRDFAARLGDLVSRLAIEPEATAESRRVRAADDTLLAELGKLHGPGFDEAWRKAEAAAHERLRERLDGVLVPAARNQEYRAALLEIRPRIAAHLRELGGPPLEPPREP